MWSLAGRARIKIIQLAAVVELHEAYLIKESYLLRLKVLYRSLMRLLAVPVGWASAGRLNLEVFDCLIIYYCHPVGHSYSSSFKFLKIPLNSCCKIAGSDTG